jgi:hypothetical protein
MKPTENKHIECKLKSKYSISTFLYSYFCLFAYCVGASVIGVKTITNYINFKLNRINFIF